MRALITLSVRGPHNFVSCQNFTLDKLCGRKEVFFKIRKCSVTHETVIAETTSNFETIINSLAWN